MCFNHVCVSCGRRFSKLAQKDCPKCQMRRQAPDAAERQRIETIPQCDTCGGVFEFMPPDQKTCGGCQNTATRGSVPSSSSSRRHHSPADAIVIADSSDIEEIPPPKPTRAPIGTVPPPLTQSIIHFKKEASEKRLTPKVEETTPSNLQDRTRVILMKRQHAKSGKRAQPGNNFINVSVTIFIQHHNGSTSGTRVLPFGSGFEYTTKMEVVLRRILEQLQEDDGSWKNVYPECTLDAKRVQWTFNSSSKTALCAQDRSAAVTIHEFFVHHSASPGFNISKKDIKDSLIKLRLLVPEEIIARDSPEPEPIVAPKKRRGTLIEEKNIKREKLDVKLEPDTAPPATLFGKKTLLAPRSMLVILHTPVITGTELTFEVGAGPVAALVSPTPFEKRYYEMSVGAPPVSPPVYFARTNANRGSRMDLQEKIDAAKSDLKSAFELLQAIQFLSDNLEDDGLPHLTIPLPTIAVEVPNQDFRIQANDPNQQVWIYHEGIQSKSIFDCERQVPMVTLAQTISHISFKLSEGVSVLTDFRAAHYGNGHQSLQLFGPRCHT
ncbi:hypothetical protein SISNIDRAFT_458404, partial [Sistotremastrum niveocremeum HHB9708]